MSSWELIFQREKMNTNNSEKAESLQLTVINNWHSSTSSSLQSETEKASIAGETKRNKPKPSPVVKHQHGLLNCTTPTDFKETRMLPPKISSWMRCFISHHPCTTPEAFLPKPFYSQICWCHSLQLLSYFSSFPLTRESITYLSRKE